MQFDQDISGRHADIFLKLREILLDFPEIRETKNAKQTSYRDAYAIVAMLRDHGDRFVMSLGKGVALLQKYPFLQGDGKIVRHLYFSDISDLDERLVYEIIEETLVLNLEAFELKRLARQL